MGFLAGSQTYILLFYKTNRNKTATFAVSFLASIAKKLHFSPSYIANLFRLR